MTALDLVFADPTLAREAGFLLQVSLTKAVHDDCVAWTEEDTHRTGVPQDETGRLWDVLYMAAAAARREEPGVLVPVPFTVYRVPRTIQREQVARAEDGDDLIAEPVQLRLRRAARALVIEAVT